MIATLKIGQFLALDGSGACYDLKVLSVDGDTINLYVDAPDEMVLVDEGDSKCIRRMTPDEAAKQGFNTLYTDSKRGG